ncbi:hypothetical protein HMPREF0737_00976 [Rothia mucilaginosa M508]|uniref:DUF6318 domain-containing protein n=1 Tax=Rothia mucilaginosa M508 TaxID=563033 RepID=G5ERR6_9MICC|nr:DUF6318 family protein [Rothia mucilaginosa]EHB87853.1 hypothetical protein HMPREF0737_00976 [Rothia mucilaginosa M508]
MNPNMLNRRSILTGGTLISLSTLLATCVPHDITTAGDGSTASGAATTSSPSNSTSNNANSSEYRKADAKGPAQNVPKPNAPEDGYRAKTPDGLLKTMDAWNQWINYGVQTGDYSKAREFLSTSNDGELKIYREIEALYQRGGWVIDGIEHFEPEGIPRSDDGQTYYLKTSHEWDKHTEVEPDGRQETWSSDKEEEIYTFALEHRDGRWQILYSRIEA